MEDERPETRGGGSESLKKYLKEISRLPRITAEEERVLGRKIQKGDQKALRRLVEANLESQRHIGKYLCLSWNAVVS